MYHYEKITYLIEEAGRALVKRYYVITLQWDLFAYCHKWKCCTLNTHVSIFFLGWYPITFSVYIVRDKPTCRASGHYIKSCVKRYDILLHYTLYRCMHLQLKVQDYSYFTALNLALNNPIIIHKICSRTQAMHILLTCIGAGSKQNSVLQWHRVTFPCTCIVIYWITFLIPIMLIVLLINTQVTWCPFYVHTSHPRSR